MADPARKTPRKAVRRGDAPAAAAPALRKVRALRDVLPALQPAQATALRGFFSSPQAWTLRDNGLLQFMPGRAAPPAQTFELEADGVRLGLCLQVAPASGGLHWSDYGGRSRVLAWALAHEAQLMRLSEAFGVALTPLTDPPDDAGARTDDLWLDFIVDEEPVEGSASRMPALQGALRMPPAWTERLLERADPPYDTPQSLGRWQSLGLPLRLQWRIAPLPLADWQALSPGDVLVVGRRSQPPLAEAQLRGLCWPLSATPAGWTIAGPPRHTPYPAQESSRMNDIPQDTGTDGGSGADGEALARQLPVEVSFELGRSELRVGELSALQPGYLFPLAAPLEGANVTIRANGQAVGQGEVVAVGDTLGVRLLWWN
jgi:type III secretion protein Q